MDPPPQDRIVRLNVGGTAFMTAESTLTWPGPESFFAAMLSGRMPSRTDESGWWCCRATRRTHNAQAPSSLTGTRGCLL